MNLDVLRKWKFLRLDLAGAAVVVAGAAMFYYFAVQPIFSMQQRRQQQQTQLANQQRSLANLTAKADDIKHKLDSAQGALKECWIQLEPVSNVNARIGRITELATKNGLKVDEIRPCDVVYGKNYGTVPIRLNGSGGYGNWADFLHQLPKVLPDTAVESFQVVSKIEEPGPIDFQVSLNWFVCK